MSSFQINRDKKLAVIAPGGLSSQERLENGFAALESLGFSAKVFEPISWASHPWLSQCGAIEVIECSEQPVEADMIRCSWNPVSAQMRAEALMKAFQDKEVGAILATRGGYGCQELLPFLDFEAIEASKKPLIGYSDITGLLLPLAERSGVPGIHGGMLAEEFALFAGEGGSDSIYQRSVESIFCLLRGEPYSEELQLERLKFGSQTRTAVGEIVPGNLTLIASLLGTPWQVDLNGKILFIEEVGEPAYRIHRLLQQLRYASCLDNLAGLVIGRFSLRTEPGESTLEVSRDELDFILGRLFSDTSYPIFKSSDFGHSGLNLALPVGAMASIDKEKLVISG